MVAEFLAEALADLSSAQGSDPQIFVVKLLGSTSLEIDPRYELALIRRCQLGNLHIRKFKLSSQVVG